jgi:tetratricopeptide (TPR) repeat protein
MTGTPTTPDPIEIAMVAEAGDTAPDSPARRLLVDQGRLVRWQIASERAGFALKVLTGAAGLAAATVLGVMAWNASQDDSLVIDPVSAPEDLVREGATGAALAHALQDKLVQLRADTRMPLVSADVRERDGGGLKVLIPGSGVSLADLDLALRQTLGRQTHLSAEVSRVNSGAEKGALAITARLGSQPGVRLVQPDGDLDALMGRAAEYAYRTAEPLKYSSWLAERGRTGEAAQVLNGLTGVGSDMDRAQAYYALSSRQMGSTAARRRDLLAEAVRLSKERVGLNNYAVSENDLGHAEAAYRARVRLMKRPETDLALYTDEARTLNKLLPAANLASSLGDSNGTLGIPCSRLKISPCQAASLVNAVRADPALAAPSRDNRVTTGAVALANLHDLQSAEALLVLRPPPPADMSPASLANDDSLWLTVRATIDRDREDWTALLRDADAWETLATKWPSLRSAYTVGSSRGLALAALGDRAGAERAAAMMPLDCYRCVMRRGLIAARLGQSAAADRWYAEAVRQGPSLPQAEAEWAGVLVKQGRVDAALAQAAAAARKGPRFADAHEVWGEALLAKGDARAAVRKFAKAAELAPRWGRLHLKWGEALAKLGKTEEARAKWRAAAGMDLTAAERARLQALTGKRTL